MRPTFIFCVWCLIVQATISCNAVADGKSCRKEESLLVRRESRRILVSTENGEIAAARVGEDIDGSSYLLHFFTMDPNSLFLPVVLHSDMVFYVHTGSGKLSWTEENKLKTADLRRGDVYRLKAGAVFFIQSNLETETERQKLRITSIFANSNTDLHEPPTGPYSSIGDMILGFDKKVLQAAFKVPDKVIEEFFNKSKPPAIIHGVSKSQRRAWEMERKFLGSLLGSRTYNIFDLNKKKGKSSPSLFNLFKEVKDFENCNGWSTTVTKKKLSALKDTNIGLFMVNLTAGSMMGPHWNPVATEIAVVLQGRGMIRVVCSGNMSFEVEEGDIFAIPRFHPMAQMAFNNETFVFMGFSNSAKKNHPQFLAGQASVLRTLSKDVLARSFNVNNRTMDQLLASQQDSVILGCISCAEEELRIVEEAREKEREEAREREEEEAREREEDRREREEEEAKRQEEERKRQEEEEEEAAREREEEEAKRQEEERKRREEEEAAAAAREREEEEAKRQEEERKRREEEEEAAAAAREREEEEEAEAREREEERRRQEEQEAAAAREREREEEEARRQEEERKRREEEEEEEAASAAREREEERRRREEEAEAVREREEERRRRAEEAAASRKREHEEERRRQVEKEVSRREEEERRRWEEEAAKREEEERERREEEEEEKKRQQAASRRREEKERRRQVEEEERMARREEEERQRRERREGEQKQREARQSEEEEGHQKQRGRWSEEEEAAEEERRREEEEEREEEAARQHHEKVGGEEERRREREDEAARQHREREREEQG